MPFSHAVRRFPARIADLAFALAVPEGFSAVPLARETHDFDNPMVRAPLLDLRSTSGEASIVVLARPVYETGSVLQWTRYLAEAFLLHLEEIRPGTVGDQGCHRAILAEATTTDAIPPERLAIAAFEDGGWLVTVQASAPTIQWPLYGEALVTAARSITLLRPAGSSRDLDSLTALGWRREDAATPESFERARQERAETRAPSVVRAAALLATGRFDEAEQAVLDVDASIEGVVAVARLFEARLRELAAAGADGEATRQVFERALRWAHSCYPDPHTGCEAENYDRGRREDLARLSAILDEGRRQA